MTVHRCAYAVYTAISEKIMQGYIRRPDVAEASEIAYRNSLACLAPEVYGELDGTHIPIHPYSSPYGWIDTVM